MKHTPPPTWIRHLLGEHPQDMLPQLKQSQVYHDEQSSLLHFPCEQAVGSYLRFFDMLRLNPRPEEAPRPNPENIAYTLGTMSRLVARLCATQNESRVSLFDLVDEMETREQQLLQSRALLRHTLKTLHNFMVSCITGKAANPAFYSYDTKIVYEYVLRHLTESLAQHASWRASSFRAGRRAGSKATSNVCLVRCHCHNHGLDNAPNCRNHGNCHERVGRIRQPVAECHNGSIQPNFRRQRARRGDDSCLSGAESGKTTTRTTNTSAATGTRHRCRKPATSYATGSRLTQVPVTKRPPLTKRCAQLRHRRRAPLSRYNFQIQ